MSSTDFFDDDFTNNLKTIKEQKNEYLRLASNIVNQLNAIENAERRTRFFQGEEAATETRRQAIEKSRKLRSDR